MSYFAVKSRNRNAKKSHHFLDCPFRRTPMIVEELLLFLSPAHSSSPVSPFWHSFPDNGQLCCLTHSHILKTHVMDQQICSDTGHLKWIFFSIWTWFCTFFAHRNPWFWWLNSSKVYVSELKSTQQTVFFNGNCFLILCITFCETCKMQVVAITMCLLFSFHSAELNTADRRVFSMQLQACTPQMHLPPGAKGLQQLCCT